MENRRITIREAAEYISISVGMSHEFFSDVNKKINEKLEEKEAHLDSELLANMVAFIS